MPDGGVRAAIHINHGMAEHALRYRRFARALSDVGFAVFAHDHRGHGETTASDAPLGVFADSHGFRKVMADVLAVNTHIRLRDVETPVVCFGHSMGSIIALNFALRYPERVNGLACWNTGVETGIFAQASRLILGAQRLFMGRNHPSVLARKLTFETWNKKFSPNRTDFDWLSRDRDEVDKYITDPFCGFDASTGLWLDLLEGIFYGGNDNNFVKLHRNLPVHILGGEADPCSNQGADMKNLAIRLRKAGLKDVVTEILPDTQHESLNETNRDKTTAGFIDWLDKRFP